MSDTVENQSDVEVRLEKLRSQLQFQERAQEIVIRDSEILNDLAN